MSGRTSYLAGLSAEDRVAADYARSGHVILSRRWRGRAGEIDIVAEKDGEIIFVEVKKSSSFARAAERLSPRQMQRIHLSAEDYLGHMRNGLDTPARIDLAMVDGAGRIALLPNAVCG